MSKNKQPSVSTKKSGQKQSAPDKGKKNKPKIHNNEIKEYFRRNKIFADFIEGIFYDVIQITPDMLSEADTTLEMNDEIYNEKTRICVTKELIRDVAKIVTDKDGNQCYIGIEDQSSFDKDMSVRAVMYDSMTLNGMDDHYIPTMTVVCNWSKKKISNPLNLSSIFSSSFAKLFGNHIMQLALTVFNVIDYIYNQDEYGFKTELKTVFAYVSGALNKMSIEEIKERCPWIVGQKVSKLGLMIINLYMKLDINFDELDEEENYMTIYQEAVNNAAKAAKTEQTFELALKSSKELNRSFESMLDVFGVSPEEREICIEKYRKIVG
ncbi:MAG: hypothetical protein ACI4NM_05980 [Bullifex sp.]